LPGADALNWAVLTTYDANWYYGTPTPLRRHPRTVVKSSPHRTYQEERLGVFVPGYLKTFVEGNGELSNTYAELAGFPPTSLGTVEIQIEPMKKQFRVVREMGE
jgi:hypothetical protein